MKAAKLSLDFTDRPEIIQTLRRLSVHSGESQKTIVIRALEAYFAQKMENQFLMTAAESTFAEWNNDDDDTYNSF
jgi:hypothetical protein